MPNPFRFNSPEFEGIRNEAGRELTGQRRNRVFVYDAYIGILNEGGQPL
jgi:hypothetical protein